MDEQPVRQGRYTAVIVDTLTQAINDTYTEYQHEVGKPGFDQWRDYGIEPLWLYQFIRGLKGAIIVQVLGREGTGKTVGAGFLDPNATMYLNIDRKPLTFAEPDEKYPSDRPQGESNSLGNYKEPLPEKNPQTRKIDVWHVVRNAILYAYSNRVVHEDPKKDKFVIFILAHTEIFKGTEGIEYERMKTLGKVATKLNIEGSIIYCFYTKIDPTTPIRADKYKLMPHGSGFNTARTPMGKFDDVEIIPNNYQLILDKIHGR